MLHTQYSYTDIHIAVAFNLLYQIVGVIVMVLHTFATKCMTLCFLMLYILKGELTLVVIYIHIRSQMYTKLK